jgi:type IV secretory pathway TrbD component
MDGYEMPLHSSLIQPILLMGVPKMFAVLNGTMTAALVMGLHVIWLGVPVGIILHFLGYFLTKNDPMYFDALKRHIWQKPALEP